MCAHIAMSNTHTYTPTGNGDIVPEPMSLCYKVFTTVVLPDGKQHVAI